MRFWDEDSRVAMSEERHEQKSATDASAPRANARNFNVPRANARKFSVPRANLWMRWIDLCLVIFDAVFVVDADNCSCKGQDFAKVGEDCRVYDSHRLYEVFVFYKEDTEADEQKGKKNLMLHLRC